MARLVVFGGDGFIGRHLVEKLATDKPTDTIIAFDRFSGQQLGATHRFDAFDNVYVYPGDFSVKDSVHDAIDGADYVFHLISTTNPVVSLNDPYVDIDTNVRYSLEIMQACAEAKVKKLIFLSSGGTVYGDVDSELIHEDTIPNPRSPYGIGKLTIEHYLRYYQHHQGLQYIVYRVANPYGPGQNIHGRQGVIPIFLKSFMNNEAIHIFGDGSMVRDYIFIDDLINMIASTYARPNAHSTYNLGSGEGSSINDLIKAIERHVGTTVEKNFLEAPSAFVHKSVLNISRFVTEFSVSPLVSLDDGIGRTWQHVKTI